MSIRLRPRLLAWTAALALAAASGACTDSGSPTLAVPADAVQAVAKPLNQPAGGDNVKPGDTCATEGAIDPGTGLVCRGGMWGSNGG